MALEIELCILTPKIFTCTSWIAESIAMGALSSLRWGQGILMERSMVAFLLINTDDSSYMNPYGSCRAGSLGQDCWNFGSCDPA